MNKDARKEKVEDLFQKMYKSESPNDIKSLMESVSKEILSAGYMDIHQQAVAAGVKLAGDDIIEKFTANFGQKMSSRDREMVAYEMGQMRNFIDSSLLPD